MPKIVTVSTYGRVNARPLARSLSCLQLYFACFFFSPSLSLHGHAAQFDGREGVGHFEEDGGLMMMILMMMILMMMMMILVLD